MCASGFVVFVLVGFEWLFSVGCDLCHVGDVFCGVLCFFGVVFGVCGCLRVFAGSGGLHFCLGLPPCVSALAEVSSAVLHSSVFYGVFYFAVVLVVFVSCYWGVC